MVVDKKTINVGGRSREIIGCGVIIVLNKDTQQKKKLLQDMSRI